MEQANTDELFERLSQMQEQLPEMQELGESITRSSQASEVVDAFHLARQHSQTASFFDDQLSKLQEAIAKAVEDDDEELGHQLMSRRQFLGGSYSMHTASAETAQKKFSKLLDDYGFVDVSAAKEVIIDKEELEAAKEKVTTFFHDYHELLKSCAEAEGVSLEELGISGDTFEV